MQLEIKKELKRILNEDVELEIPPDLKLGDYSFPCFPLVKKFKKDPNEIALELKDKLKDKFKIEVKGGYLNFFLDNVKLAMDVLGEIIKKNENYGSVKLKKPKKILIESPGPNTNKPLHLGHLRNIFLGISIRNILNKLGNKVFIVDIINDRGIHISKSMIAYKLYGKNNEPDIKSDHFVGKYYILYNEKVKEKPEMEEKATELLVKWEQGDKETIKLWKKMNDWALEGFKETYKMLDFKVDKAYYESEHYNEGKKLVLDGLKKGLFYKKEGTIAINLKKDGLGEKVLLRENGTSVYVTQDLSLAIKRYKDFKMDQMIYVVGNEQIYHFKVLFNILEKLKQGLAKNCYHLAYGMVNLPEGRMKSREGTIVDADDLISEMIGLAKEEIIRRYKELNKKEIEKRSKIIGLGALRFFVLKIDPYKDMMFNPKESISFDGDTGPYVQYAHARCSSILKNRKINSKVDFGLFNDLDYKIVKILGQFSNIVVKSGDEYKPNLIANYLLELTRRFNDFYEQNPVLKAGKKLMEARLLLVFCVKQVLNNGLYLLGIEAPDEM